MIAVRRPYDIGKSLRSIQKFAPQCCDVFPAEFPHHFVKLVFQHKQVTESQSLELNRLLIPVMPILGSLMISP